jgi:hypothetical protein
VNEKIFDHDRTCSLRAAHLSAVFAPCQSCREDAARRLLAFGVAKFIRAFQVGFGLDNMRICSPSY